MLPRLYNGFNFANHYAPGTCLGTLNLCKSCKVKEERNGEYILELEAIVNDPTALQLASQRIIQAKPNPHDALQYFEIQSTRKGLDGIIRASAKHCRNFAFQFVSEGDMTYIDNPDHFTLNPQGWWNKLFNDGYINGYASADDCPYTFVSDITATADCYLGFNQPVTIGDILGGKEGSMIDLFHGEFKYNNYLIQYLSSRGETTNYKLRYGKNISTAEQSENCLMAYSHVLPYGQVATTSGRNIILYADVFEIPNNDCTTKKVYPLDCTDALSTFQVNTQQTDWYVAPRAAMTAYAAQYASANNVGKINVSITVDVRSELDAMQQLKLCDMVKVELETLGITTTAKIVSATYDVLLERWDKLIVGMIPISFSDIILDKRRVQL